MLSIKPMAALAVVGIMFGVGATARAETIDVAVPFAFQVAGVTLPAGHYELQTDMSSGVVQLLGDRGTPGGAFVLTEPASGKDPAGATPALTFSRYEAGYRLTGIWESGTDGRAVMNR